MSRILSVSIAAYNVQATLEEALNSFIGDDVKDLVDVMIVDDGSKDNTAKIAKEYEEKYPGTFRLISKENGGWGSTLNVGMRNAVGKYFKQLDGDDYFSAKNLPDYLRFLAESDADYVQTPFVTFEDGKGGIIGELGLYEGDYKFFPMEKTVDIEECTALVPAMHSTTVKTSILQENDITILEHCFYTDVEFILKAINCCETIAFYDRPIYFYRLARDGQSMSQAGVRKHYREHQRMLTTMLKYYKEEVRTPFADKILAKRLDGVVDMQYIFYMALKCTGKEKRELREFDQWLQKEAPDFYYRQKGRQVRFLRKTNFFGYKLVAAQKMKKDKRLKRNIFEGV